MVVCLGLAGLASAAEPKKPTAPTAPAPQPAAPAAGIKAPQAAPALERASASTILMTIPGIPGGGPGGKIAVRSYQEGQAWTPQATGRVFQPFIIRKTLDKASALLWLAAGVGKHFPSVLLEFARRGADGKPQTYLKIELKDVIISGVESLGGGGGAQEEEVKFLYQSMQKQ